MKTFLRFLLFASLLVQFSAARSVSQEQVFVAQTGNSGTVSEVALSPDGTLALTAGTDKIVCLWEVESGLILHEFRGFKDSITGVAFTADGRSVVIASGDTASSYNLEPLIKVFDVKTGLEVKQIHLEKAFFSFAISSDGRYLLGDGLSDSLYDLNRSKPLPNEFGYEAALSSGTNRIVFFADKKINILDIDAAKTLNSIPVPSDVEELAISSDGLLVAAVEKPDDLKARASVYVWDVGSGKELFKEQFFSVESLAFSSMEKLLAVAGRASYDTSGLTLYDLSKQKQPRQIKLDSAIQGIHFSADGRYLKYRDMIIDVAAGAPLPFTSRSSISFSQDSKRVIFVSEGKAVVYDLLARTSIRTLKSLGMGKITRAAVSSGNRFLALASDETLLVWDLKDGRVSSSTNGKYQIQDLAFSRDEKFLVFVSSRTENNNDVVRYLDTSLNVIWEYKFRFSDLVVYLFQR